MKINFLRNNTYYVTDNSDLLMHVIKVKYVSRTYVKVKMTLSNKHNHIFYETGNYKLYWKNIQHWNRK